MDIQKLEQIFKKNLEPYKKDFGFVCFFGSLNLKHDLDLFVSPNKNIKKGYFLKKLISFLEIIKSDLSKEKTRLLVIWHSTYEEEVEYLNTEKNSLIIHISSFPDIQPVPTPNYLPFLKKTEKVLSGDYNSISKIKRTKLDYYYNYLFISNCLFSNYPGKLEEKKVSAKVNYIYKHLTGKKRELNGSSKQQFFDCCDFLDSLAYQNPVK
ncbi:MAG: hypothetical protein NTX24_02950 [Candidatus Pacearchaeota archaeon]|nr:hypothetical protein [Candidatus Pacearchaeota archaeon]